MLGKILGKKPRCFAVGISSDLLFSAGTLALNLREIGDLENADFIVFTNRISQKDRQVLTEKLGLEVRIYCSPIPDRELWRMPSIRYFSPLVLSKFESLALLEEYREVIWMDTDVTVLAPLVDQLTKAKFDLAFVPAKHSPAKSLRRDDGTLPNTGAGLSAGFLVLRDSLLGPAPYADFLVKFVREHGDNLYLPEQAAFESMLLRWKVKILFLDENVYCAAPADVSRVTRILHSWGSEKFWKTEASASWNKFYQDWRDLGGSKFSPLKHLSERLRRFALYGFWSSIGIVRESLTTRPRRSQS